MHSPRKQSRRRYARKEKGKIKMLEHGMDKCASDSGESDTNQSKGGPQELRSNAAKRAIKSTNVKLRGSTHHKRLVIRYGYNEYI